MNRHSLKLIFLLSMVFLFYKHSYADKTIELTLRGGTKIEIPLGEEITMSPDSDDFLNIISDTDNLIIPLENVLKFNLKGIKDSSVDEINADIDYNATWEAYTFEGRLLKTGTGKPEFSFLPKGVPLVIKQGNFSYKVVLK